MSSEELHAPRSRLTDETLTHHYAIVSLKEELDAVDWYRQRAEDCEDEALKGILLHNMREEIEHSCMILEWLRRSVPDWTGQIDTYLYSEVPVTEVEEAQTGTAGDEPRDETETTGMPAETAAETAHRFTVGSLKDHGEQ
jgi:uncharacterized protein